MGDESDLLARLQAGNEDAFVALVDLYHPSLLRFAEGFVRNRAVAEEVVQDAWLGVVKGIEKFEGRSSLKTWLFRIVGNRARTAGVREHRHEPVGSIDAPAVSPARFGAGGHWIDPPAPWTDDADARIDAQRTLQRLGEWLDQLPEAQRQVVLMRDIEGLSSEEVCSVLDIGESNQRVLLHRGRSKLRALLEQELREVD